MKKIKNLAAAAGLSATLALTGCAGGGENTGLFKTVCDQVQQIDGQIVCEDGSLALGFDSLNNLLGDLTGLLDQLNLLGTLSPLAGELPLDDLTAQLEAGLAEVLALLDSGLADGLSADALGDLTGGALLDNLQSITQLLDPSVLALGGDSPQQMLTDLLGGNPPDVFAITDALFSITDNIADVQSALNTSALIDLVTNLQGAAGGADDAIGNLASSVTGVLAALQNGDPAAVAASLAGLTEVINAEEVTSLLETVSDPSAITDLLDTLSGLGDVLDLDPNNLDLALLEGDAIGGLTDTLGGLLGLGL